MASEAFASFNQPILRNFRGIEIGNIFQLGTKYTQAMGMQYVDEAGSRARLDVARDERIGGVAFWALGFDSPETWASVAGVETPKV